jgi:hypothetical protein
MNVAVRIPRQLPTYRQLETKEKLITKGREKGSQTRK